MVKKTTDMAEAVEASADVKLYELMFILKPDMLESAVAKKLKEISKFIEDGEGKIKTEDNWGKKTLAYRIKQQTEGIYLIYVFESPAKLIRELNEHLRIDNSIVRHMIISVPAGYTYLKYVEETPEEKSEKKKTSKRYERRAEDVEVKEKPKATAKKEEAKVDVKEVILEEKLKEEPEKESKINKVDLDEKLDKLLGGDLNI
jgi:small subunit ribosomal protein S6